MTVDAFRRAMAETEYIPAGSALHQAFHAFSQEALKITVELNGAYHTPEEVRALMSRLTASEIDETFAMFPPFHTDCGKNIKIGKRVFINAGCQFQDQGGITIGDDVLIGPQTIIATLNHDPDPGKRGGMFAKPVNIGSKVWLGARVTICPGVTIGEGAIVGAGAVVTKNVPPRTVVAGVPAKVKNEGEVCMQDKGRIVFLDYLRVVACFMVMLIHASEPFYLGGEAPNVTAIAGRLDAFWISFVESICRVCVPLFVMASSYLLFPLAKPAGVFFRRRLGRIVVPFLVWAGAYIWWFGDSWGKACFNFPDAGGHLWFVPMLLGLYLLMPLLSPWAEKVSRRELRGWLILWLVTTTFPYLRRVWTALYGAPSFGAVPYLYGECPWNMFGMFHYVSGFAGYMLLGFWFRRFAPELSWRRTLAVAMPLWLVGAAVVGGGFYFRIPEFPCSRPYAFAVDLEMSIEYCSTGVALTVASAFMIMRKITDNGAFYSRIILPLSRASYGTYLLHMFVLLAVFEKLRPHCCTPVAIFATATLSFIGASLASLAIGRIPRVGRWIVG